MKKQIDLHYQIAPSKIQAVDGNTTGTENDGGTLLIKKDLKYVTNFLSGQN